MKPIRIPFLWIFAPVLALQGLVFQACTSPNQTLAAQVAVMLATEEVVKDHPERAAKAVAIADQVASIAGGDTATTVDALLAAVRARIDWDKLSPTETTAVNLLLGAVHTELTTRIQAGQIPVDQLWRVALVASWIKLAAEPYAAPGSAPLAEGRGKAPGWSGWSPSPLGSVAAPPIT